MTDQIEKLFADLRAETLPAVRPPGTEPLRRAVRRRRAALSGAAAVLVLGVAGLVAVMRPSSPQPVAAPPVSTPSAQAPVYSDETLRARVSESLKLAEQPLPGVIITDTGSGPKETPRALLGGAYEIRMTCYGSGSMNVTVSSGAVGTEPQVVVTPVVCDTTQTTVLTVPVVLAGTSGTLLVRIEPDVAGPGQAAFGWTAQLAEADETRWEQAAKNALGGKASGFKQRTSEFVTDGVSYGRPTIEPGRYRVRAVCLGFGTVRLAIGPDVGGEMPTPTDEATVTCSPDAPRTATVTYTASSKGLSYDVDPDGEARNRSVLAAVLESY
ncbi:hypothetical protein AB0F81_39725 [Actinoplanes sp. NPDC024001]|uniref:hypothetical protein n=1 Tax=Actinoplanes sp. NPDC024001 TaxID=3154598 RepID=UPI003402994C